MGFGSFLRLTNPKPGIDRVNMDILLYQNVGKINICTSIYTNGINPANVKGINA